jgi:hypothetical protein
MRAQSLIDSSAFGPDELRTIQDIFDEAWEAVAPTIGSDQQLIDETRYRLASCIVAAASNGIREPETLKEAGLASVGVIRRASPRRAAL